jgi:hypothetical protein
MLGDAFENQDWPRIIKELTIYANSRLKFWSLIKNRRLKGQSPEDIALNAIEAILSGKWHWDSSKSDLITYLKFHVVRGMVANLAKDSELRLLLNSELSEIDIPGEFNQEDELNSKLVLEQIRMEVKDEDLLVEIIDLLCKGLKRGDVCKSLSITLSEYDNAVKRLRRKILKLEKTGTLKLT